MISRLLDLQPIRLAFVLRFEASITEQHANDSFSLLLGESQRSLAGLQYSATHSRRLTIKTLKNSSWLPKRSDCITIREDRGCSAFSR
jgi:hypothetical protein